MAGNDQTTVIIDIERDLDAAGGLPNTSGPIGKDERAVLARAGIDVDDLHYDDDGWWAVWETLEIERADRLDRVTRAVHLVADRLGITVVQFDGTNAPIYDDDHEPGQTMYQRLWDLIDTNVADGTLTVTVR